MAKHFAQMQTVQQRASHLLKRLEKVQGEAASREWPHSGLQDSTREYVAAMVPSVEAALFAAISALQIARKFAHNPVTLLNDQRLQRHIRDFAKKKNSSDEEMTRATFAYCEVHLRVGAHLLGHLEAVVKGDQTIEGRAIAHGKMWDK
jgi:hypothetical protein